jgi:hypothetical protein
MTAIEYKSLNNQIDNDDDIDINLIINNKDFHNQDSKYNSSENDDNTTIETIEDNELTMEFEALDIDENSDSLTILKTLAKLAWPCIVAFFLSYLGQYLII